jgi:hypothetical protein
MLVEKRKKITDLQDDKLLEIADILCHQSLTVRPIFECVKVFARIHECGKFTYARHPFDLGTQFIDAAEISSRMNSNIRQRVVLEALISLEESCFHIWPFTAGSSSWVLLEILHPQVIISGNRNAQTIILRKAIRINSNGEQSSTPLVERMFGKLREDIERENIRAGAFMLRFDPTVQLHNISGTGVYSKFQDQIDGMSFLADGKSFKSITGLNSYTAEVIDEFIDGLLENNFDIPLEKNPGFYFSFDGDVYSVRANRFSSVVPSLQPKIDLPPLPIAGLLK